MLRQKKGKYYPFLRVADDDRRLVVDEVGLMGEGRPGREHEQREGEERVPLFLSTAHGLIIT